MNHGAKHRKFGRRKEHRSAMMMNLVKSLIMHEAISTTLPKAKDLRPVVEKIITLAKKGDLHARRQAISYMRGDLVVVSKLFSDVASKVRNRNGGYTRIMKMGFRQGDAAPMAMIELVDR
jgi:large subunit ribosomal protein L17